MAARSLLILVLLLGGCSKRDPFSPQASPDDQLSLTPSLHEGSLVQLTVRDRSGRVVDEVKTRDTGAMKWVTGWVDKTSYLFWGADTGTAWVRRLDGKSPSEGPIEGVACARLEQLFEAQYGEHRGNCLKQ